MLTYENEIEWLSDFSDDINDFKTAAFNDEAFKEFVAEEGVTRSLYLATTLHREVADQLSFNDKSGFQDDHKKWRSSAVRVALTVKKRRQQLRRAVTELYTWEEVEKINDQVAAESEDLK